MMRINVAACDDDADALDMVSQIVVVAGKEYGFEVNVNKFDSPEKLLKFFEENQCQLLFLDVEMPGMNGLKLAEKIREDDNNVQIVFVSHHDEIVYEVFKYRPFDFVRKNDMKKKFREIFERLSNMYAIKKVEIEYVEDGYKSFISSADIMYIKSDTNYVDMTDKNGKICCVRMTLKELRQMLEPCGFIQVHMRYLINMKYWMKYYKNKVIMKDKAEIDVGVTFRDNVKEEYAKKRRK